VSYIIVAGSVT